MSWANFFHERPQSGLLHGWNEVVVQATLAEQGVCPPLGGAGFEMLIEAESLAGGAEQRQKAVGLLYRGVGWRSQKYGPSRATRAPDGVVREPLGWGCRTRWRYSKCSARWNFSGRGPFESVA